LKKKILILINSTRISGAEISLLSLVERLDRDKYELFLGAPAGELYETLSSRDHLSVVPFNLRRFTGRHGLSGMITSFFRMLATSIRISLLVHKKGIDIVYANSTQAMVYCFVIRMLTFKKIIWHTRDTTSNKMAATMLSGIAAKVICVSRFIFDQHPARASKKEVVYNGLDTAIWEPPSCSANFLKADLGLGENDVLVGQIGQLIPWKNHADLIRVAGRVIESFDKVHFIIIGDDLFKENAGYIEQLKNNIRLRGLEKHISFVGYQKNIKDYMGCLDIVMHCAINEPFGRVIIESMALEKPVVSYDSGGPREIIADQVTGFLATETIEAMVAKLLLLLKDAALRAAFGKAGRQRVEQEFSLQEHTTRIESILDTLT
jgi:glycosyltransferase involved in cell wall biosynthesis